MNDERYLIEHPTRGVVMDQDYDPYGKSANVYLEWRTKFSATKMRSEAMPLYGEMETRLALSRIHPDLRKACKVRRYGLWIEPMWSR